MISKENTKYYILVVFVSILLYKMVDDPLKFIAGIGGFAKFFSPFLIGILFALLLNPLVMAFERKFKTHRLINILISYIIVSILFVIGFKLIIPAIVDTLNRLISEVPQYIELLNRFATKYISQAEFLEAVVPHIQHNLNTILKQVVDVLTAFSTNLVAYAFTLTSLLFNILMGIILSIYMLFDKEKIALGFKKLLYSSLPRYRADETVEFFRISHDIFYSYIIGKIIDSLIIGVIAFIGFKFVIRIDNVLFLSFIIFLTNIIPYFGPFIGAVPPIIMTFIYDPVKAFWVAIFILILQQVDGNLIGPKVMGDQVGLSALWIISAVMIGGGLFGIIGVFLSVPVAAVIKTCLDKYVEKRLHIEDSN